MSSGTTYERRSNTAWACAACRSASDARGLAPMAVSLCTRVAFEIATAVAWLVDRSPGGASGRSYAVA